MNREDATHSEKEISGQEHVLVSTLFTSPFSMQFSIIFAFAASSAFSLPYFFASTFIFPYSSPYLLQLCPHLTAPPSLFSKFLFSVATPLTSCQRGEAY